MGTRQIKSRVKHTYTHTYRDQLTGPWLMQTMYLWYQIHGLCHFLFLLPQSFFKYSYHSVCSGLYAIKCVCVFFRVCVWEIGGAGPWFRLTAEGLSRHSFLLSDWTVWDVPIWRKKSRQRRRVHAWVRTRIHLVTPLPFVPPFCPCFSLSRTVPNTCGQPSRHLSNTLWLWLLAQDFEYTWKWLAKLCLGDFDSSHSCLAVLEFKWW